MARRDTQKAVTAKMYRHFAAVTLVSTAALAIATSDSASSEFNADVEAGEARVAAAGAGIREEAKPKLVRRVDNVSKTPRAATGWGSDESGGDWGGDGGGSSSYIPPGVGGKGVTAGMLRQLGLTAEQFQALSAEEQERILRRLNRAEQLSPAELEQRQQAMTSASLERAGFEGPCNDC